MAEKYINIDLDDPRSENIAEVISNKTCKKILGFIAEKEMSESDIAKELGIPLNTVGYNIEKLVNAGLIEKSEKFFWSSKGKRMNRYKVSNKRIIITPRSMIRGIVPAVILIGIAAFGIKLFAKTNTASYAASPANTVNAPDVAVRIASDAAGAAGVAAEKSGAAMAAGSGEIARSVSSPELYAPLVNAGFSWLWFLLGALIALMIVLAWNWRKI